MIEALEDPDMRWPGALYELTQGILDYNDNAQGPPQIRVHIGEEILSYEAFLQLDSPSQPTQISFVNYIKDGDGLRPLNLVHTQHNGKGQTSTLGVHGRGSKIATTALLAGGHASKISYCSSANGIGAWYGEAVMVKDTEDTEADEALALRYKRDETLTQNTTEIAVHNPSPTLIESLRVFPEWFLPVNPHYEHYRLGTPRDADPNQFTLYADSQPTLLPHERVSTRAILDATSGKEPARIEVLPHPWIAQEPVTHVFIDGLAVEVPGETFSQVYSFWGFTHTDSGHTPTRSNDSLSMTGNARDALGILYTQCSEPAVFTKVIQALTKQQLYEGHIPWWSLQPSHLREEARVAASKAWREITLGQDTYITTSHPLAWQAENAHLPTIHLDSETWVKLIQEAAGAKTVEGFFAQERARLEQETRAAARRAADAEQEGIRKYLAERGLASDLSGTGEVIKVPGVENPAATLEMAKLHILFSLAQNDGTIVELPDRTIRLDMRADDFLSIPTNVTALGPVGSFATMLTGAYAGRAALEVSLITDQKGRMFELTGSSKPDSLGNMTISVKAAEAKLPYRSLLRVDCSFSDLPERGPLAEFPRDLLMSLQSITNQSGHISREQYLASEFYAAYPPAAELLRIRSIIEQNRHMTRQLLVKENELRRQAGLPPIADPYMHDEANERQTTSTNEEGLPPVLPDAMVRDDTPLTLLKPTSRVGLTTREKPNSREVLVVPAHMYLTPGFGKVHDYLHMYPEVEFSNTTLAAYAPLEDISDERKGHLPTLFFTQSLKAGLSALPTPPGFRPVAIYQDGKSVDVKLAASGTGFFTMYSAHDVPAGLQIQFAPEIRKDHSIPTDKETRVVANFQELDDHWKQLLIELNKSTLTPKQKVDIILRAWTKAFAYNKSQKVFDEYSDVRNNTIDLNTRIINKAAGNCGYANRGFYSLVSLLGIPIRPVVSYLSDGKGNFRMDSNLHGTSQVYLTGQWVNIEPQVNYIEDGFTVQPIPTDAKDTFQPLLAAIPKAEKHVAIRTQEQEGIRITREQLPPKIEQLLNTLRQASPQFIAEQQTAFNVVETPTIPTTPTNEQTPEISKPISAKDALTFAAQTTLLATLIYSAIEWHKEIFEKAEELIQHPDVKRTLEDVTHLPPALLIPLLILLTGTAYKSGYKRGRRAKE
jgi:hypothetical protein